MFATFVKTMSVVKFLGSFSATLEFGHVIIVRGIIKRSAENFILNFLSENESGDIPLHMNFTFGDDNSQIIRNTKLNGEFGAAETSGGMFTKEKNPLKPGDKDYKLRMIKTSFLSNLSRYLSSCYAIHLITKTFS